MKITQLQTKDDVREFAATLLSPERKKPACLISMPSDPLESVFPIEIIAENCFDLATITCVPNGELTYLLAELLPESTSVYGGAARVYPIGFNSESHYSEIPLILPSRGKSNANQQKVESEIWRLADTGKILAEREKRSEFVVATVYRVYPPSLAIVSFEGRPMVPLRQELCFPGVPIQWCVAEGDVIEGTYDPKLNDFIPAGTRLSEKQVVEHYGLNNLVLGLVRSADRQRAVITVYPGVDLHISREEISHNERDIVTDFLDPGDVVAARIYRDPQGRVRLRMDDIDDDEIPLRALPIIEGGEPWLVEGRNDVGETAEDEPEPLAEVEESLIQINDSAITDNTGSIPLPKPGLLPGVTVPSSSMSAKDRSKIEHHNAVLRGRENQLQAEIKTLQNDKAEMRTELGQLRSENNVLSEQLTELRKKATAARRQSARVEVGGSSTTRSRRARWSTDEEWFTEELRRAWIGRYKPSDRELYPLNLERVSYGESFFETLRQPEIAEEDLRKAVRVILDIVSDRNSKENIHEVHNLRTSGSASASIVRRDDGSVCMRSYLEQGTPQAKRLHFWRTSGGWELSRVALHDDYRP